MKTEYLKEIGLTQEQIDKVFAENGKDIKRFQDENTSLKAQLATATETLAEANKEIEGYKTLDIEAIKQSATEWENKAKEAQTNADKQISAMKFDSALNTALTTAKARNPKAVRALLDEALLKHTDTGILGLNEQLENIRKENAYLFETESSGGAGFSKAEPIQNTNNENKRMNALLRGSTVKT